MKTLIIYCHPYSNSFNHAILEVVQANLREVQRDFTVSDLHHDQFDPTYSITELGLFHQGDTRDPLVTKYWSLLKHVETVIIITPVWWNSVPGMLKGFIDKVMKQKRAYVVTKTGVRGQLTNIKHCYVLTTSTSPTWYLRYFSGNGVAGVFMNQTLKQRGIQQRKWQNFGRITVSTLRRRKQYLRHVRQQHFV